MERNEEKKGITLGIFAYVLWGIIPLYWKLLGEVPAVSLLFNRVVWSFVTMVLFLLVVKSQRKVFFKDVAMLKKEKKKILAIILAAIFITVNWGTFIYSVQIGDVTAASLGYYINPLANVLLGTLVLKEKLSRTAKIACVFGLIGVILLTIQTGHLPVTSLVMAASFSIYGLIKKGLALGSATSLTLETLVIFPFALAYLLFFAPDGFLQYDWSTNLLLFGAGTITSIPLLLFAEAAKRISFIILGFIQYINPTIMLIMAIFLFHETYTLQQFIAFSFIWLGILIFVYGSVKTGLKYRKT
ncbi:EamA family transporter RarD [Enterococcus alishanensis]|nr:EamA family transporter RarD [Enterococcus alishanensis]